MPTLAQHLLEMYGYSLADSALTAITDKPGNRIRKVMYTTNTVGGYHRQLRKVTKTKGAFFSDVALQKLVYWVIQNLQTN